MLRQRHSVQLRMGRGVGRPGRQDSLARFMIARIARRLSIRRISRASRLSAGHSRRGRICGTLAPLRRRDTVLEGKNGVKMSDFVPGSVASGLKMDEFRDLPDRVKRKLLRLMARISEQSYRRGFQHGIVIGDRRCIDPSDFRFKRSLDKSPYTDGPGGYTSIERLQMECGVLHNIGLRA